MTFPSKRDRWLVWALCSAVVVDLGAALLMLMLPGSLAARLGVAGSLMAVAVLMVWILYGTRYTLSGDRLLVRSGPFRWTIAVGAIEAIEPTRNPLSSPACSLDRLLITYRGAARGIMISPLDKLGFLNALVAGDSALRRHGDGLRRE